MPRRLMHRMPGGFDVRSVSASQARPAGQHLENLVVGKPQDHLTLPPQRHVACLLVEEHRSGAHAPWTEGMPDDLAARSDGDRYSGVSLRLTHDTPKWDRWQG